MAKVWMINRAAPLQAGGLQRGKASLCSTGHEHTRTIDRCFLRTIRMPRCSLQGYAWEITTPEGGWGLDGVLQGVQHKLDGIANGIDTTEWSPETDDHLPASYSAADMSGGFQGGLDAFPSHLHTAPGQALQVAPASRTNGSRSLLPEYAQWSLSTFCQFLMPSLLQVQARRSARRPCSGNWGCRRTLESPYWASLDAWTFRRCAAVNVGALWAKYHSEIKCC